MNRRVQAFIDALERHGIAIDIAGMKPPLVESLATVHLRFDREALRFMGEVQAALHAVAPHGKTLVFTITAPIRLASKTATALEERVRHSLARRPTSIDLTETINGNRIRVRLAKGVSNGTRAIGFVHNPDCDPEILVDVTQSLLCRITPPL